MLISDGKPRESGEEFIDKCSIELDGSFVDALLNTIDALELEGRYLSLKAIFERGSPRLLK
jgi:hypothetical protein